jgi:hypothetical protein
MMGPTASAADLGGWTTSVFPRHFVQAPAQEPIDRRAESTGRRYRELQGNRPNLDGFMQRAPGARGDNCALRTRRFRADENPLDKLRRWLRVQPPTAQNSLDTCRNILNVP